MFPIHTVDINGFEAIDRNDEDFNAVWTFSSHGFHLIINKK